MPNEPAHRFPAPVPDPPEKRIRVIHELSYEIIVLVIFLILVIVGLAKQ